MIDFIEFRGNNGQTVILNDDIYPLQLFDSQPETVTDERQKPSQHGLFNTFTFMTKRTIHMEGDIFAADSSDFLTKRQVLLGAFVPAPELGYRSVGILEVKYTGLPESVTCECYLDGMPSVPLEALSPARGTFAISLQAFDPIMYGSTVQSAQGSPAASAGGFGFPFSFPLSFQTGAGGGGDFNVTNDGNAPVFPTATIYGPCKDPRLTLHGINDDYSLAFTGLNLDANQTITVDFKNRTVLSNTLGSAYSYIVPGSTWWSIPPGSWTVSFRAFSSSTGCKVVVNYTNGYMV